MKIFLYLFHKLILFFYKIYITINKFNAKISNIEKEVFKLGKLYNKYTQLKKENPDVVYAFKSGIFYIFLDEDAEFINTKLGLKLTPLNETILKCGFPVSKLSKYMTLLEEEDINYKIVDNNLEIVTNTQAHLEDNETLDVIDTIRKLDLNTVSPMEALNILVNLQNKLIKQE